MNKHFILIVIFILGIIPVFGAYNTNVPQETLKIAKETINRDYSSPKSKIIRVGIGNSDFSSYVWNNAGIYGTGEFEIYNNKTYIATYDSNNVINIKTSGKIFILTDSEDNKIAEVSGPVIFKSDYGFLGIKDLKRSGVNAQYRGTLEIVPAQKEGHFHIVNNIEVEEYLKGVVPNEMPVRFGLEALKAQSIAARNYVLSPRVKANKNYDVVDSVASQVYFGANTEKDLSNQAVFQTTGIVAIYNWNLILALYSSTAGGYTENYENAFSDPLTKAFPAKELKPYLKSKPDYEKFGKLNDEEEAWEFYRSKPKSFDIKSPYYRWEREWTIEELQNEIQNHIAAQSATGFIHPQVNKGEIIGNIKKITVLERGNSGKIIKLQIETDSKTYTVEKELVIRRLFTVKGKALPSANVIFTQQIDEDGNLVKISAYGGGFGHGVGLSQYGAGYMGQELNYSFEKILQHYYSGISLSTVPIVLSANANQKSAKNIFFTKNGKANLVIDNKYKVEYLDANINGVDETIEINTKERYSKIDFSKYLQKGLNNITFTYPDYMDKNKGLRLYIEIAGENEFSD